MDKINTLLLVDDDEINNFLNERLLKGLNIANQIKVAKNGKEALSFILDECIARTNLCPEIILLDQNMPVMDGFEFLEEFHRLDFENKHDVVIYMLSAASEPADKERMDSLKVNGFIMKPLTKERLLEVAGAYFKE
ncbi:response regulator [Cytophagaceae bacterium ABcell3]|nr:response regulator [Cytophagaceae bacterium ABcell3]